MFSCLRERYKLQRVQGSYYQNQELLYISDHDIEYMVDDLLKYLQFNPTQNPYSFIVKYFEFIFSEKDAYNNQCFYGPILKSFLQEYVFERLEK